MPMESIGRVRTISMMPWDLQISECMWDSILLAPQSVKLQSAKYKPTESAFTEPNKWWLIPMQGEVCSCLNEKFDYEHFWPHLLILESCWRENSTKHPDNKLLDWVGRHCRHVMGLPSDQHWAQFFPTAFCESRPTPGGEHQDLHAQVIPLSWSWNVAQPAQCFSGWYWMI